MPDDPLIRIANRVRDLERRVASTEAICEVVEVSDDATTLKVARTLAGTTSENVIEGVINTLTTHSDGGLQHVRLRSRTEDRSRR